MDGVFPKALYLRGEVIRGPGTLAFTPRFLSDTFNSTTFWKEK